MPPNNLSMLINKKKKLNSNSTILRSTKIITLKLLPSIQLKRKKKKKEDLMIRNILEEEYKGCFMENRKELKNEAKQQMLKNWRRK